MCYSYFVKIRNERREAAIERMADHLLLEGMSAASLRPLAAAAGTSDRMLLYYFADKDELVAATLDRVAARLTAMLDAAIPAGARLIFPELLTAVWGAVGIRRTAAVYAAMARVGRSLRAWSRAAPYDRDRHHGRVRPLDK